MQDSADFAFWANVMEWNKLSENIVYNIISDWKACTVYCLQYCKGSQRLALYSYKICVHKFVYSSQEMFYTLRYLV